LQVGLDVKGPVISKRGLSGKEPLFGESIDTSVGEHHSLKRSDEYGLLSTISISKAQVGLRVGVQKKRCAFSRRFGKCG
jgi:hypothetical protein